MATGKVSIGKAAELLGVTREKLEDWISRGVLPIERQGNSVSLPEDRVLDLRQHLQRIAESPLAAPATLSSRRDFLLVGISALGAFVAPPLVKVAEHFYAEYQRTRDAEARRTALIEEARYHLNMILAQHGRTQTLDIGKRGFGLNRGYHPDNLAAGLSLTAALGLLDERDQLIVDVNNVNQDPDGNLLVVGGPVGNPISRIAFEFEGSDDRHLTRRTTPIVPLRWWGVADEADAGVRSLPRLDSNIENVGWVSGAHWYMFDRLGESKLIGTRRVAGKNRPVESYLTITRIPNFVSETFAEAVANMDDPAFWPSLFVVDGRTGIATRAVELLSQATGCEAVEKAEKAIRSCRCGFQLLFRVGDLSPVGSGFDRYSAIEFVDMEPLDATKDLWVQAHRYARQRVSSIRKS